MFDIYNDIASSETAAYLGYEISIVLRVLFYIGLEILFHKIKERYPKIKSVMYFLRVIAVINFAWFFIEYTELKTHIPIKESIINYFVK